MWYLGGCPFSLFYKGISGMLYIGSDDIEMFLYNIYSCWEKEIFVSHFFKAIQTRQKMEATGQ